MAIDIKKLRAQSGNASLEALQATIEAQNAKSYDNDPRYWKITVDKKTDVGQALIRFLPAPDGEAAPYVHYTSYWFKGPGGKVYNERSLLSLGQDDPVNDANKAIYEKFDKNHPSAKIARNRAQRHHYIANILVIKDYGNPENDGKVFLFSATKQVFSKIEKQIKPDNVDIDKPCNPFDVFSGKNFYLTLTPKSGDFPTWENSKFLETSEAIPGGTDEQYVELLSKLYPLSPEVDPSKWKTYDELAKKFDAVQASAARQSVSTELVGTKGQNFVQESEENLLQAYETLTGPLMQPEVEDSDDLFARLAGEIGK